MMESFYGGRQGIPFILKTTFSSYAEMIEKFQQKNAYKDVAYGEHVMISNEDPLDETNGNVYRRGYDGPEYIGNFRGPQGTPFKFQGEYNSEVEYYKNLKQIDIVSFSETGSTYIRSGQEKSCIGILPTNTDYWTLFSQGSQSSGGNANIIPTYNEETQTYILKIKTR